MGGGVVVSVHSAHGWCQRFRYTRARLREEGTLCLLDVVFVKMRSRLASLQRCVVGAGLDRFF